MLDLFHASSRNCEGISRRSLLKIGGLGLGNLALPELLRLRAQDRAEGRTTSDTAVILLWLDGGPSQFETYDPKPDAPAEYRGPYQTIQTNVVGLNLCELLPMHAQIADKIAVVRSVAHRESGHGSAVKNLNTGYLHPPGTNEGTFLYPGTGAVVAKSREQERRGLPHYVCVPTAGIFKGDVGGGAYLGSAYDPFAANPADGAGALIPPAELSLSRLQNRRALLSSLDRMRRDTDASGMMEGMDAFTRQAFEMVTGRAAREALDLSREPTSVRQRYGFSSAVDRNAVWGQNCLLARRLVEAGVSFVGLGMGSWDDHGEALTQRLPQRAQVYDRTVTALIEDLYARGLDRKVLVLAWGEFGRTPRINRGGRDHWPSSMSVMLAGGGLRMGQAVGSTNARGERPQDRSLHPNDVLATVYRHLGIDHRHAFVNPQGRPIPLLPNGEPIAELVG
ncbi:MAG: DUF1501 domain-containing protein [Gemmataceae bacterium]|nr:DUF1501 domain-containing protein [Gemmataceae bacterium]